MKTIILDRDGVILKERGEYTFRLEDCEVLNKNIDVLAQWASSNEDVQFFVLTNQGGIAKHLYSMVDVEAIHKLLQQAFVAKGIAITEFYICPHHQDFGLCLCRKPKTLLFEKLVAKYQLNPEQCLMIGDKERDTIPAHSLGMKTLLINSNDTLELSALI
jgi:D-glycero-D-manno-heptose 1,7-bisphosphate phosphatase